MAKRGQQIDELYLSLGLDIARLQLDFDTAGQTVSQSMVRLGGKINKLQIKTDIDLAKLEGVGTELDKLKVKHEAINKQLDIQRQKEQILTAALRDAQKNTGLNSGATSKAETDLLRQQRLVAQTESEVRKLQKAIKDASGKIRIDVDTERIKQAERNISDSIARMNAKVQNIRVKAEIDTATLKSGTAEIEKQKIAVNALNQELSVQYQKLAQLQNAYKLAYKHGGKESIQSINANTDLLRQQQAVKSLENEIQKLNAEIAKTGNVSTSNFAKLSNAAIKAKSKVESFVAGVNKINASIAAVTTATSSAMGLFNLSANAVKAGHDTMMLANRLHTTAGEAGQLKRAFGLVDADVTSMIPLFARLNKQVAAAGEKGNELTESAERYGMTLTDGQGNILTYTKMLGELAKGYKYTQEQGESAAFVAEILGARGAGLEPLLADYDALIAASKDVVATGLFNPAEAEKAYRELKKMEFEVGQLKGAIGNALLPVTVELMPEVVDGLKTMVRFVADNKDGIKEFGILAADVFGGTAKAIMTVVTALGDMKKAMVEVSGTRDAENVLKANGFDEYLQRGNTLGTILGGMVGGRFGGVKGATAGVAVGGSLVEGLYAKIGEFESKYILGNWDYMKQKAEILEAEKHVVEDFEKSRVEWNKKHNAEIVQNSKSATDVQAELEKMLAETTSERLKEQLQAIKEKAEQSIWAGKSEKTAWTEAEKEIVKAVKAAKKETEKANKELTDSIYKLSHTDLEGSLFDADQAADAMRKRGASEELILRETELKKTKIQRDFQRDVVEQANNVYRTDLQNRLLSIDQERQAWIQKGLAEVDATRWAETNKAKIMEQWESDVAANINSLWKTELQNRLETIDREKKAWIEKGLAEVKATEWAEKQKLDARRNAAIQAIRDQKEEMEIYRQYGERGLVEYLREQNGITDEDLRLTPEQLEKFQQARQTAMENLLPNFRDPKEIKREREMMKQSFSVTDENGQTFSYDDLFGEMKDGMAELTEALRQPVSGNNNENNYTDARHVEVTVNIENAVTQDNEGMRILADTVADRIQPAVVSALGGDSNSFANR